MADNMDIFMHAIRIQESGDDYTAVNASGHSGAYQFSQATWTESVPLAGILYLPFALTIPALAPASVQDAVARALMSQYYGEFSNSFYNVAEAWYGGPGAVGHPDEGGGPGFPNVGQYASDVIAIYNSLGGTAGGGPAAPPGPAPVKAPTLADLLAALNAEINARIEAINNTREQAAAGDATEAVGRALGDDHSREQAAAANAAEINARIEGVNNTRAQDAARNALEINARIEAINNTREQAAAATAAETAARIEAINNTREQASALYAAEVNSRIEAINATRQQAAAGIAAATTALTALNATTLKYAQSIPGLVDDNAANGYDNTLVQRGNLLQKLLDTAVAHEPLVADLVSKLATTIVDIAGLEDPIIRIAAQLILKQVIDKLGINTVLGAMINDLIGNILGTGTPKTLKDIMADIGNRLDALEDGQAGLAPLAPEADNLHELGTLVFDALLLAYFAAAVADPVGTADGTADALAVVVDPLLAPIRAMLGM